MANRKYEKKPQKGKCRICRSESQTFDYKDVEFLKNFMDKRGKIISKAYTGNCAKHQRAVTNAIKRMRNIALLPFIQ